AAPTADPQDGSDNQAAQDTTAAFQRGRDALNAGNFAEAHRIYSRLWEHSKSPDIAANLGVAELELRQYSAAATHLAYALENLLPSTSVDQKAALEASFQQALQHVGVLELSITPSDATLTIDSRPA